MALYVGPTTMDIYEERLRAELTESEVGRCRFNPGSTQVHPRFTPGSPQLHPSFTPA